MLNQVYKQTITRYAPSPTGKFHIGGAKTALFNYLYAKKHNGNFILRIEDTDVSRNTKKGIDSQYQSLKWLGLFPDESFQNPGVCGPYLQSQKLLEYKKHAYWLLDKALAYRCFCTQQELDDYRNYANEQKLTPRYSRKCRNLSSDQVNDLLEKKTPFVIRLKIDDNQSFTWTDLIRGEISVPGTALSDYVILRSNDIPTYNFAVVVDDYDMKISHVLRGQEHLANTPYQLATYHALGWNESIPSFGHLSIIVNKEGKKLSKREPNVNVYIEKYQQLGYLPQAVINFLVLLGWCSEDNKEIMSLSEMIEVFDLNHVSKSPCYFDVKKLNWICSQYFKKMNGKAYWNFVSEFFDVDAKEFNNQKEKIALLFQKQITHAKELNDLCVQFFLVDDAKLETIVADNRQLLDDSCHILSLGYDLLVSEDNWSLENIRAYLKQLMDQTNKKGSSFYLPLRLVFTLNDHGPELFKVMDIIGYQKCHDRLLKVINLLKKNETIL